MFMLALSRGLPYWMEAQRGAAAGIRDARRRGYVNVVGSTVLINGVGGIGAETARLCAALGASGHRHRPAAGARLSGGDPRAFRPRRPASRRRLRRHHRAAHPGVRIHVERGSPSDA